MDVSIPLDDRALPPEPDAPPGGRDASVVELARAAPDLPAGLTPESHLGLWQAETATGRLRWNGSLRRLLGVGPEHPASLAAALDAVHPDDRAGVRSWIEQQVGAGTTACRIRRPDGEVRHVVVQGSRWPDPEGATVVGTVLDVTDLARTQAERAATDPVTGVRSWDGIVDHLATDPGVADGHVVVIDIDGFRPVNEAFGYEAGDEMLRETARRVSAVVPPGDAVGRGGADDLVVVTRSREPSTVKGLATRILEVLREPFHLAGGRVFVTASVGIAAVDPVAGPRESLRAADIAMHRARAAGRDRVAWYDEQAASEITERLQLGDELREAVDRSEFVLHYQPVFDLRSGRMVAADARIRWEHPDRGPIPPERFLATAQATGVLDALDDWSWAEAARMAASWRPVAGGIGRGPSPVFWVRVPVTRLAAPGFADRVLRCAADADADPARLGIMVAGTVAPGDLEVVVAELSHLRRVGLQVILDRFGVGGSSLAQLHQLPVDVVRLDGSLFRDLGTGGGRADVAALVALAHASDVQVVVDGGGAVDDLRVLRHVGCDLVAGDLLARPVAGAELPAAVAEGARALGEAVTGSTDDAQPPSAPTPEGKGQGWLTRLWFGGRRNAQPVGGDHLLEALEGGRGAHRELAHHLGEGRRPVLVLVDLDGYRALQAMREPAAVDLLLEAQARRLAAIEGTRAYHLGDDVFALVLPDTRRGPVAQQVDLVALAQGPKGMTACVGIAHAPPHGRPADIEHAARRALAVAKRRGQGSVVDGQTLEADPPIVTAAQARALYAVLREGYLRVHYQPIFSLADDHVVGWEALVRPQLDHGLAGPEEAVEVATHLGLVPDLDAVARASIFTDGPGFDMAAGTRLLVAIAPEALGHRSLRTAQLRRQLENAGLDASRVVFQLREGAGITTEVFAAEARRLRDRGFAIALDDVGGPGADLRTLRAVPVDMIKLAPGLVAAAREDRTAAATLDALCAFAHHTGALLVATGVETPRVLANARSLRSGPGGQARIHAAQGYHLGKPQPQPRFHTDPRPTAAEDPPGDAPD